MTPAARVQTAIEILERVESDARPADQVVTGMLRGRRYIGSKDRRAINALVYDTLRSKARLDWWLARAGAPPAEAPAARPRLRLLALQALGPDGQPAEALFDGSPYGPLPLSAEEAALAAALSGCGLDHPEQPPAVRAELPDWLHARFEAALGAACESELAALRREAPLDLRVNTLKATRAEAVEALRAESIDAVATPWSPVGLRLSGRRALPATRAFRDGLVEVQDEASQLAALLVEAEPGMAVADLCAGAGGKTLALAAAMAGRGRLVALDRDPERLARAAPRLARAGVTCVEQRVLSDGADAWLAAEAGAFDRVLVDAPCSGAGAWRRNPDARWRLTEAACDAMTTLQAEILQSAAGLVRPGGRLIYATCSLLAEENERQVEAFLAAQPDFALLPYGPIWQDRLGQAPPDAAPSLTLTPARHGTDGFFVAILERRP